MPPYTWPHPIWSRNWTCNITYTPLWTSWRKSAWLARELPSPRNSTWDCSTPQRTTKCTSIPSHPIVSLSLKGVFCYSYGFVTNTRVKFIVVIDSSNVALRENEVRAVGIHSRSNNWLNNSHFPYLPDLPKSPLALHRCHLQSLLHSRRIADFQVSRLETSMSYHFLTYDLYLCRKFDRAVQKLMSGNA